MASFHLVVTGRRKVILDDVYSNLSHIKCRSAYILYHTGNFDRFTTFATTFYTVQVTRKECTVFGLITDLGLVDQTTEHS